MKTIEELRKEIDQIDWEIVELVGKRLDVVRKIGEVKKEIGRKVVDLEREKWLAEWHSKAAAESGVSVKLVAEIFKMIVEESRRVQR